VKANSRPERVRQIMALRAEGLSRQEIGAALGISKSTVSSYVGDSTGEKTRARKASYGGRCETCGARTDGSNGRAKAPRTCASCNAQARHEQALIDNPHGTRNRYYNGCHCADCTAANRAYTASLRTGAAPNHGTYSGYANYRCRCDECREAKRAYDREHPEPKLRWQAKNPQKVLEYSRRAKEKRKVPCTSCGKLRSEPHTGRRNTGLCLSCWVASDEFRAIRRRPRRRQKVAA
jgi:hypothetical protein